MKTEKTTFEIYAPTAEEAIKMFGENQEPVDMGPSRRFPGKRIWGFQVTVPKRPVTILGHRVDVFLAILVALISGIYSLVAWGRCLAHGEPSVEACAALAIAAGSYSLALFLTKRHITKFYNRYR